MAWMIDGDVLTERLRGWLESSHGENVYNSGYDDAIWHVLDVIEHMPTLTQPNEWVSVEERPPEEIGNYLVVACDEHLPRDERIWNGTIMGEGFYGDEDWVMEYSGGIHDITGMVTHWMPFPDFPKEEP